VAQELATDSRESGRPVGREKTLLTRTVRFPKPAICCKGLVYNPRSCDRRIDERDGITGYVAYCVLEQREVRAAENYAVSLEICVAGLIEIALNNADGDVTLGPAFLRKRDEHLARLLANLSVAVPRLDGLAVGPQANGRLGRKYEVRPARARADSRDGTRLNDADHRNRLQLCPQGVKRHGGSGVARHHEHLDALHCQFRGCLGCVTLDRGRALGPVGKTCRIAKVYEILARKLTAYRFQHGQPADTGIEDAYREFVVFADIHTCIVPKDRQVWNNPARIHCRSGHTNVQKLLYGVGAFVVLLILVGFLMPRTHQVEVTQEIDAHAATVFALVNDFQRYALWAPLSETDPNVRIRYSGERRGVGATMTWDGAIVGTGTQTIVASTPFEHVDIVMSPGEPGESRSWFDLSPGTGTTRVTWGFEADYGMNIVGRYFAPMLGSIVARDYHAGLLNLKELAESLPSADFSDIETQQIVVEAMEIAYLSTSSRPEPAAISEAMGTAYFQILNFIDKQQLQDSGAPMSITRTFSGSRLVFDAAIPVRGVTAAMPRDGGPVKLGFTYEGPVIRVRHIGSYRSLSDTHRKISSYLAAHGIERNGDAWESYVSDPGDVPENELLTYVYYPIRPE